MDENLNINETSGFLSDSNQDIIKVIGVGGGGGNAVNYMFKQNIPNVNFVVCNTDEQALSKSPVPYKLILGPEITHGRGAGNLPEVGRQCAEASAEDIKKLFDDHTEMVFITAGMGGGTGTGAGPVVARLAKEAGLLTIAIVTVPFLFEGEKKILKALEGAAEMKKHVDALLVINNENLIDLYKDLNFFNAFERADDTLANAARSISEIISENCYINVDFQDVKTILKDSGTAIISTAYGEGEHRISQAIHNALHSPLLKTHDINTSKRLLFKFVCSRESKNPLRAEEINEITQFTANLPKSIDVKWGIGDNPEMGDNVKVTILASGFDVTLREKEKGEEIVFKSEPDEKAATEQRNAAGKQQMEEVYGTEKLTKQLRDAAKIKYAVLLPSQFDDHEVIAMLERTPTYNRDPRFNEELARISQPGAAPRAEINPETPRANSDSSNRISF
ncbi:MAG: cell division protein FtsZ [Muribaculaceae bacterium]|nr:cell division protein FtsZ [Muribaculaceae bacterium]